MEPLKMIDENTPIGTEVIVAMDNIIYLARLSDPCAGKYTATLRFGDGSESAHWRERVCVLPARETPFFDDREDPREVGYPSSPVTPTPLPIVFGPGSKRKAGGIIELPYLDGVQHASFPEVKHEG